MNKSGAFISYARADGEPFAALLREHGFDARRGQQFSGSVESPDVVSPALPWLHFEVKRCERVDLRSWCAQAEGDCGGKPWVVALRWNDGPWLFAGRMDLLFKFLRGELPPEEQHKQQETEGRENQDEQHGTDLQ